MACIAAACEQFRPALAATAATAEVAASFAERPAPDGEVDPVAVERTNRAAVTCGLIAAITAAVEVELSAEESSVARRCGGPISLRDTPSQVAALRSAGLDVTDLSGESLRGLHRYASVRSVERANQLLDQLAWARSGGVATLVADTWAATTTARPESLAPTIERHTKAGVDAMVLADALIHHEAGRHLGLVKFQSNRMAEAYGDYRPEDLFGWGWTGLIGALRRYSPEVARFSTYAVTRITGQIRDGVRSESWVPKRLGTYARKVASCDDALSAALGRPATLAEIADAVAADRLTRDLGRVPTLAEIAERVEADRDRFAMLPRLERPASIDEFRDPEAIPDAPWTQPVADPEREMLLTALRRDLNDAMAAIDHNDAAAVRLVDLEGLTPQQAAAALGVPLRELRARRNAGWDALRGRLVEWADA